MADEGFRALALESPVGEIAAACMRSIKVNLLTDMMLTKEPQTPAISPWHHDLPYNWVDGTQVCGMWLSLDHATAESGAAEWIRGSHKWGRWFIAYPATMRSMPSAGPAARSQNTTPVMKPGEPIPLGHDQFPTIWPR